jgi:hypothetical protein
MGNDLKRWLRLVETSNAPILHVRTKLCEMKYWYDVPNEAIEKVSDHHWTDVEDWPQHFAEFTDDEVADIQNGDYVDNWLADRVFAARWVRVTHEYDKWYFQGAKLADIRKAVRAILPLDEANLTVVLEGPDIEATLTGTAIERFVRSGRLPRPTGP